MQENKKTNQSWKALLISKTLAKKSAGHKIAYIAVFVDLNVAVNAFSLPLGFVQFSLTLFMASLTGILIGPIFGFAACFLGDALGYFIGGGAVGGFTPWIGVSMGVAAVLAALIVGGVPIKGKGGVYIKLAIVCLLTFIVCTYAIGTTAAYYLWNFKGLNYSAFVVARLSVQIWNNIGNSILLFICVPILNRIKPLKIHID
jgi:predicted membrane protein